LHIANLCKEAEKAANNEPDARVRCETTAGDFTIEMHRDWAPLGYRALWLSFDGFRAPNESLHPRFRGRGDALGVFVFWRR
jgi:hypothetical protein